MYYVVTNYIIGIITTFLKKYQKGFSMLTPGVKTITALLAIGTIATCKMAYNRRRDIKDAAKSLALIQQRRKDHSDALAQKMASSAQEISNP